MSYLEGCARAEGTQAGRTLPADQTLQASLQRGWWFGSQAFREKVLALAQSTLRLRSRKADFAAAPEVMDHQQAEAEALVQRGLKHFGLSEPDLGSLARGDKRKAVIGLADKNRTTVALTWIAERLDMGTRSTVSRELATLARQLKADREWANH